nr:MAG: hypothetical protein [Metapenaeopsis lamellata majanivirus]
MIEMNSKQIETDDIKLTCLKTCLLEYMLIFLSLTTDAICLFNKKKCDTLEKNQVHAKKVYDTFLRNVSLKFDYTTDNKLVLNINIERDDKFLIEHVIYIIFILDVFISSLDKEKKEEQDNNYNNIKIDMSYIDENVLLSDSCENSENSLYGFTLALYENVLYGNMPFSFLFTAKNKNHNGQQHIKNIMRVFFTSEEMENICKRNNSTKSTEIIRVIFSRYKKKINNESIKTPNGIKFSSTADIIIQTDKERMTVMNIVVNIIDGESYTIMKRVEQKTKMLNKALIDYTEAYMVFEKDKINRLKILGDVVSFRDNIISFTSSCFPTIKLNGSRKRNIISEAIKEMNKEYKFLNIIPNNENKNNIIKRYGPFSSYILPLLTTDTITNMWLNRCFLSNIHRNEISKDDINKTCFLEKLLDLGNRSKMLKCFTKMSIYFRNNKQSVCFHNNKDYYCQKLPFDPINDINNLRLLPDGRVDIKKLFIKNPTVQGHIVVNKKHDDKQIINNNEEFNKFCRYFTHIGKEMLFNT